MSRQIIFLKNMFIDSKIFHHFDDGVVDDFPGVDSDRKVHVRTAGIVEQLKMENIRQKRNQRFAIRKCCLNTKVFFIL
jgi:hypothetical protein